MIFQQVGSSMLVNKDNKTLHLRTIRS